MYIYIISIALYIVTSHIVYSDPETKYNPKRDMFCPRQDFKLQRLNLDTVIGTFSSLYQQLQLIEASALQFLERWRLYGIDRSRITPVRGGLTLFHFQQFWDYRRHSTLKLEQVIASIEFVS